MLKTLNSDFDSEEYLDDYIEEYVKFGIKITNNKTKLGKRVYLIISLISILILFFDILEDQSNFKNKLNIIIKQNIPFFIILGLIILILIIVLKERKNFTIIFVIIFWILWILYFSVLVSFLLKFWPHSNFSYSLFVVHHVVVTLYCVFRDEFDFRVLYFNLFLSFFGILFVLVQNFWVFDGFVYLFLLCVQYFLVNCFYFLLVLYFMRLHQQKFWKRRKAFIGLLIFILANFTVFFSFIAIFYLVFWICKNNCNYNNKEYDYDSEENYNIDIFMSKK